jgi:integrase
MATVTKRTWTTRAGEPREAWTIRYRDKDKRQRLETFETRTEAVARRAEITLAMRAGVHTARTSKATLADAYAAWMERGRAENLERSTLEQRRQHWTHIEPLLGAQTKLGKLSRPMVEAFRDRLLTSCSRPMAAKVMTSAKSMLKHAVEVGLMASNPASATSIGKNGRHRRRLKIGETVPSRDEYLAMLAAAHDPRAKAFLLLAGRAGIRASEARALRWRHVHLGDKPSVTISERADHWNVVSSPKSESSARTIPLGRTTVRALQELLLAQGRPANGLVFGNGAGNIQSLSNIASRWLAPVQKAAGVVDEDGRPKYSVHALRHLCISTWIAEQTFDLKTTQVYAGHSSLQITTDVYGHFIPRDDVNDRLDAADTALFGA